MEQDLKETLLKVAEYSNMKKDEKRKKLNRYFICGGLCLLLTILDRQFGGLSILLGENISEFVNGALCSLALLFELIGFYNNNHEVTLRERKIGKFSKQVLNIKENIKQWKF